eukprot:9492690-Pyramimonas_sp.AAC.1
MALASNSVGWLVGEADTILKSQDGGMSWHVGSSGLVPTRLAIAYAWHGIGMCSDTHGWVVGQYGDLGVVIHTKVSSKSALPVCDGRRGCTAPVTLQWNQQSHHHPLRLGSALKVQRFGFAYPHTRLACLCSAMCVCGSINAHVSQVRPWRIHGQNKSIRRKLLLCGANSCAQECNGHTQTSKPTICILRALRSWQDGGALWPQELLPFGVSPLRAVQCISTNPFSAVAVGDEGLILKTDDDGTNWQQLVRSLTLGPSAVGPPSCALCERRVTMLCERRMTIAPGFDIPSRAPLVWGVRRRLLQVSRT